LHRLPLASTNSRPRPEVTGDPHSPDKWRVIGPTRNLDAWYEAFGVKPGSKYYLAPEQRVRIWGTPPTRPG